MTRAVLTVVSGLALCAGCSGSPSTAGSDGGKDATSGADAHPGKDGSTMHPDGKGPLPDSGKPKPDGSGSTDAGTDAVADGGVPAGWLYTQGNGVYLSTGSGGTPWMGRGVNMDDIFLCGYDDTLWMSNPDTTLETIATGLIKDWKPSFIRMSLSMASPPPFTDTSWLTNPAQYKTPMTNVIDALGKNPGVYVLVTLRSDASMIGQDTVDGDPEATGLPSDSTTTPDSTKFPMGTDPVYVALVDTFANSSFVLFGLTNEPGGNKLSNSTISAAMNHAVGVIRAEEDKLGVPHHIVSVQGNGWTSDISFYSTTPLPYDNVVYEVHGYPPSPSGYTYSNIPVILGEYGNITTSAAANTLYADLESKKIPNLAWDFEPYSDCRPDLLEVTTSATTLTPTAWGDIVQGYLTSH